MVLFIFSLASFALAQVESLSVASKATVEAIRENPVNIAEYFSAQVDFWGELLIRFVKTAKPNVVFDGQTYTGLQITLYEQPSWSLIAGKVSKYPDVELQNQPSFLGVEWVGFPLLQDLSEIFTKLNPEVLIVERSVRLGLTYEFREK